MADQYRKESDMYRGGGDRPWSNRAGDEVRSWFGDDEARQRRERDEERQNQGSRQNRGWEDERDWYRSGSNSGRYAGSRSNSWDDDWSRQDRSGPSGQQGWGRESERRPYGGGRDFGSQSDSQRGYGSQSYRDDEYGNRQPGGYGGGYSGMGGDYRSGSTGRNSQIFGTSGQFDRSQDWQGGGAGAYTGGGSQPAYGWTSNQSSGSVGRSESHFGKGPKGYQRSDERIREEVSDQLTFDHSIDASELTVEVKSGQVTLSGSVRDREQKRRAEDIAERVMGVTDVTNNLRVSKSESGGGAWGMSGSGASQGVSGTSGSSGTFSSSESTGSSGRNKATSGT